jgi:hypothetical protein
MTQERFLPVIVKAQNEAVFIHLQVLYSLHQGHVKFLSGDYRARVIDVHGPDAFPKRAPRQGKDGLPRTFLDNHALVHNPEQAVVDMSKDDDPEFGIAYPTGNPDLLITGDPLFYTNLLATLDMFRLNSASLPFGTTDEGNPFRRRQKLTRTKFPFRCTR